MSFTQTNGCTNRPGVDVGHDADFTLAGHIDGQQFLDLFAGAVLDVASIDFYVIVFILFYERIRIFNCFFSSSTNLSHKRERCKADAGI